MDRRHPPNRRNYEPNVQCQEIHLIMYKCNLYFRQLVEYKRGFSTHIIFAGFL